MKTVSGLLKKSMGPLGLVGSLLLKKKSKAPSAADLAMQDAANAQQRAANAAQEDAAVARSEQAASGRRLRGLGRRALAFQGMENGLASTLAG